MWSNTVGGSTQYSVLSTQLRTGTLGFAVAWTAEAAVATEVAGVLGTEYWIAWLRYRRRTNASVAT